MLVRRLRCVQPRRAAVVARSSPSSSMSSPSASLLQPRVSAATAAAAAATAGDHCGTPTEQDGRRAPETRAGSSGGDEEREGAGGGGGGGGGARGADAKAARKAAKAAVKAEQRARLAGGIETLMRPCDLCAVPRALLFRCQVDASAEWRMVCKRCWPAVSGGVRDGDAAHPHYRYGGTWKALKR